MGGVLSRLSCRQDEEDVVRSEEPGARRYDETWNRESVFYDARESMTKSMIVQEYASADAPLMYARGSIAMDDPKTLLSSTPKRLSMAGTVAPKRYSIIFQQKLEAPRVRMAQRGYPGDLVKEELDMTLQFRRILREKDDPDYQAMVDALAPVEEEPYALCRFLRARQFRLEETMKMMDKDVVNWKIIEENDFYPTFEDAVGCPGSVFLTQFPVLFSGKAKNGCPLNYLMLGRARMEGVECVTNVDRVKCYTVHTIMYQFKKEVALAQAYDPDVVRCECIMVVDLKGLDASQLNKKTLNSLAGIGEYMGFCPEIMNRAIIINAPRFFSVFWGLIKKLLAERSVAKIEIYTNESKGRERLLEIVDANELLADYGGQGPSFDVLVQKMGSESGATRQIAEVMKGGEARVVGELTSAEKAIARVYSRSGGKLSLSKDDVLVKTVELDNVDTSFPKCTEIASDEKGPGKLEVSISGSRSDYYLVHIEVFALSTT